MARNIPGSSDPRARGVDNRLPTIEQFPDEDLALIEGLIDQDDFVELKLRELINEFKQETTQNARKKEIVQEILGDLYFILKNPRNNFTEDDTRVLNRIIPLVEAQARQLQINVDSTKQVVDREIAEIGIELAKDNKLKITDDDLRRSLGSEIVTIAEATDTHVILLNDQFTSFSIAKDELAGKYEFAGYGRVEKQTPNEFWPIPEAGETRDIIYEGQHVGSISSPDGRRMIITTIADNRRIITSRDRAAARMEKIFTPRPEAE